MTRLLMRIVFSFYALPGTCQTETTYDSLIMAQELYENGQFQEAIQISEQCTKSESVEFQWHAYRIQSQSYLAKLEIVNARKAAVEMLNVNPSYRSNLFRDSAGFTKLLSEITVIPKYSLGVALAAGPNNSILDIPLSIVFGEYFKEYKALNGFHAGVQFGIHLSPNWIVNSGLQVYTKNYEIAYSPIGWDVNIKSRLSYVGLPICAQYVFNPEQKIRYFVEAGLVPQYMIYANTDFNSSSTVTVSETEKSLTKANVIVASN